MPGVSAAWCEGPARAAPLMPRAPPPRPPHPDVGPRTRQGLQHLGASRFQVILQSVNGRRDLATCPHKSHRVEDSSYSECRRSQRPSGLMGKASQRSWHEGGPEGRVWPSRSRTLKARSLEATAALGPALGHAPRGLQSGRAGLPAELEGAFCSFQKLPGLFLLAPNPHIPHRQPQKVFHGQGAFMNTP